MKGKATLIVALIIVSLLPLYVLYKYLQRIMRPRESGRRLLAWVGVSLLLIFGYSFLVVLVIKLLFPGA